MKHIDLLKRLGKTLKEEAEPTKPLNNPSLTFNNYNDAIQSAQQQSAGFSSPQDRMYIIKYKYYRQTNKKPFIVIHNKQLIDSEPNWEAKGYNIVGWVSPTDGVVTKTEDGRYVKGQHQ